MAQDADFAVVPVLAINWDSPDGKTWSFELQPDVMFTNGELFASEDVVYSFDRLKAKVSPFAAQFANIVKVEAADPTHVTFNLETIDSEFPAALTDRSVLMLCKSVANPSKEFVGTGPFMLESFSGEDRAVLVKNPNYWQKDESGNQLPYLDGATFIYSPDAAGQVEGLQGGALNFVGGLTAEQKLAVEANPSLEVLTANSNNSYELQIRCDRGPGKPSSSASLLTSARPSRMRLMSKDVPPMSTQMRFGRSSRRDSATPPMAPPMKEIGVDVKIRTVPPDVYYSEGKDTWFEADFGIVDWGSRAVPVFYFNAALTSAPDNWNYSRWSNSEFDELTAQIPTALDDAVRIDLYKQAQTLLQEQVPVINFLSKTAVGGESANLDGVELRPNWNWTVFSTAYFSE